MIISSFNIKNNIWDQNPNIKYMPGFDKIYKKDRSRKKNKSSDSIWACLLYVFEDEMNPYHRMRLKEREEQIKKKVCTAFDLEEDYYKELLDLVKQTLMTKKEREIANLWVKFDERNTLISTTPYNIETAKFLDEFIGNTEKLYKVLERLEKELNKERQSSKNRADYKESLIEKGL